MNRTQQRYNKYHKHYPDGTLNEGTVSNDRFSYGIVKPTSMLRAKDFSRSKFAKSQEWNDAETDEYNRLVSIERNLKLLNRIDNQISSGIAIPRKRMLRLYYNLERLGYHGK